MSKNSLQKIVIFNKKITLIYNPYLEKILKIKKIKKNKLSNSLSGIIINLFNFLFILIGGSFINNTKVLSLIIISSVCFYLFIYFILKKITISKNEFSS